LGIPTFGRKKKRKSALKKKATEGNRSGESAKDPVRKDKKPRIE